MKDRITSIEEVARQVLVSNWDNVLRTTPRAIEKFEEDYPRACELVSEKVRNEGVENLGSVFRPGVPDFLGFDDDGDYLFVEVKGEGDGLRHSQLKWFRDFGQLRSQIWFTDSNDGVKEKMETDRLDSYSLSSAASDRGEAEIREGEEGFLHVEIPQTLAAAMGLKKGDRVNWKTVDRSSLQLDTD